MKTTYYNTCINIDSTCDRTPEASCIVFVWVMQSERNAVPLRSSFVDVDFACIYFGCYIDTGGWRMVAGAECGLRP